MKLKTGQSTTAFKASGLAKGDYVKKVTSSDTGVVKVSSVKKDGTFKLTAGKKTGNASVTVTLASKKTVSFKVAVQKSTVKKLTLAKGTTYTKLASSITVAPVSSQEKITYSSSDKKIVTVTSKGVVKGLRKGTATIAIRSGSKKITCKITVK